MMRVLRSGIGVAAALALAACAGDATVLDAAVDGTNPFVVDPNLAGKQDSEYLNPDGVEVEVDIEADVDAPGYRRDMAPAILAQYAMTYLRSRGILYLESLAEDASSKTRVEWLVDGEWKPAGAAADLGEGAHHFRIRGMNAVLLERYRDQAEVGKVFEVPVPIRPFSVMTEAGDTCAEAGGHITLSQSVYWYLWDPERSGCTMDRQPMKLTVSKVLPGEDSYPEYDRLVEDGVVTAVVFFGQIADDPLTERDPGYVNMGRMARNLERADYAEVTAPLGRRFEKKVAGVLLQIDLYSPAEFSGLSDYGHAKNFERGIEEHEVVVYDGHSMLGASDFWSRPAYPDNYQVFLYGGCLGYEYYVRPIVDGKAGWGNVDIVSSVVEVSADANYYAGPFFAHLEVALKNGFEVSWKRILGAIRNQVGDSTFGASGVRENCFTPSGSRCEAPPADPSPSDPSPSDPSPSDPSPSTPPSNG